jgi:hypothetical protein
MKYYALIIFWTFWITLNLCCTPKKIEHKVSGEAKVRMVAEQEICIEENGFKTDEQKRDCIMAFLDCRTDVLNKE